MSESTSGHGWTAASNATVRAHAGRTSSQRAESGGIRLATLHNPTQTGHSNRLRKSMTANTTIVICRLILLIVTLVVLELHIRSLTRHSFLSQPQIPYTSLDEVTAPQAQHVLAFASLPCWGANLRLKSDTASACPKPFKRSTSGSPIAARLG
jgi:hypothetical protein